MFGMSPKQPSPLIEHRQIRAGDTSRVPCYSGRNATPKLVFRQQAAAHRLWKGSAQNNPLLLLARSIGQRSCFSPNKHDHPCSLLTNKHQNIVEWQGAMDTSWNTGTSDAVYRKKAFTAMVVKHWKSSLERQRNLSILGGTDTAPRSLVQLNVPQAEGMTRDLEVPSHPQHSAITKFTWDVLIKGY